jgi:hypothetical protein
MSLPDGGHMNSKLSKLVLAIEEPILSTDTFLPKKCASWSVPRPKPLLATFGLELRALVVANDMMLGVGDKKVASLSRSNGWGIGSYLFEPHSGGSSKAFLILRTTSQFCLICKRPTFVAH